MTPSSSSTTPLCCLILGGNSDIGIALAHRFAQAGFRLLLTSRRKEKVDLLLSEQLKKEHGIEVEWLIFEGLAFDSHLAFYQQILHAPDVVICAFGYLGEEKKARSHFEETQAIIHTNFLAQVSILNIVAEDFAQRKQGTIIGISSVAGDRGRQSNYLYGAAKAGWSAYLSGLRNRLHPLGIQVLTVKPGFVYTKMTSHLRLPSAITASPSSLAQSIWRAYRRKQNVLYHPAIWRWIMWIIQLLPEALFKRLRL